MNNFYRAQAVYATHPNAKHGDGTYFYDENDDIIILDETKITEKQKEIENLEAIRIMREERNKRIAETDWWVLPDRSASQAQKDYRKSLRDLPSTASPKLDADGELINVTWPTKPE
jgi:hypothetical protein